MKEDNHVLSYTYKPDIYNWLHCFSSHLDSPVESGRLNYPVSHGNGYAEVHTIEEGLSYRLVNYKLNTDFTNNCEPSTEFQLIIYFYQFNSDHKIRFEIDSNVIESDAKNYRAVVMTNSRVKQKLVLRHGTEVRGLTIQASEDWINQKIADTNGKNYSLLKQNNCLIETLAAKAQRILNDIFNNHEESHMPLLYITSRVLRLLEHFLGNLLKRGVADPALCISSKDFESILKIEGLLLENYSEVFPKIEKLARLALMSESKLKKIYKQAFGMGLYKYYQKNRMHKARELLSSGDYTVSQVGCLLGYHNHSNFSSSFKKEFNQLPRDFHNVE